MGTFLGFPGCCCARLLLVAISVLQIYPVVAARPSFFLTPKAPRAGMVRRRALCPYGCLGYICTKCLKRKKMHPRWSLGSELKVIGNRGRLFRRQSKEHGGVSSRPALGQCDRLLVEPETLAVLVREGRVLS